MNYDEFHRDHIPKSCLPSDYGGDLPSVESLHEAHCIELNKLKYFFAKEEQQAALEFDEHFD